MSDIKVVSKGLLTTIQDLGRFGHRSQGIPTSGAMDISSAKLANILVGNEESEPFLECTMMGPKLEFDCDTYISVTGAVIDLFIDDVLQSCNSTLAISKGSTMKFGRLHSGSRFYIAFASGIIAPTILGSASYDTVSEIGRPPLQKGEILQLKKSNQSSFIINLTPPTDTLNQAPIRVTPGPEYHIIKDLDMGSESFSIDPSSNRMAYTLHANNNHTHNYEMISSGVLPGTIQLTPAGQWIALMRDAQTTGGYPRVLQIIEEDIDRLAQRRGGERISFKCYS